MKSTLLATCLFTLLAANACSQQPEPTLTATVTPTEISLGEDITVSFTIHNGPNTPFEEPEWDPNRFSVKGTFQSSNISIINGVASSSINYAYTVSPLQAGINELPTASILTQPKKRTAQPPNVHVHPNPNFQQPDVPVKSPKPKRKIPTSRI